MHLLREVEQSTQLGYDTKIQNICETFHSQNPIIFKLGQLDPFFQNNFNYLSKIYTLLVVCMIFISILDLMYANKFNTLSTKELENGICILKWKITNDKGIIQAHVWTQKKNLHLQLWKHKKHHIKPIQQPFSKINLLP